MATKKKFGEHDFTKDELGGMTMKELVELHNRLAPENKQTAFKDKATAVDKVWGLGAKIEAPKKADGGGEEKLKKEPSLAGRTKIEVFDLPIPRDVFEARKKSNAGTGMERLFIALGRPEGATIEECMAAVGKTRPHIVGGIRWANKMGWGIKADDRKAMHLADPDGNYVPYEPRPAGPTKEEREAAKAKKEAERAEAKKQKEAEKAAKKAEAEKAKAAAAQAPAN